MKKIILILMMLAAMTASAKETIKVFFPFQVPPNYLRKLIENVNESQDKYQLILEIKMGAGGAIAANTVINTPHTLLVNSSALFTRATMYSNSPYGLNDLSLIAPMCSVPLVIVSSKYNTLEEVPTTSPIFISLSGGLGASSHLLAEKLGKRFTNTTMIPYAGAMDVFKSVATNETDFGVTVLSQVRELILTKKINALAITGNVSYYDIPTLQKFNLTDANRLSTLYSITMSSNAPIDEQVELRKIIKTAISKHKEDFTKEFCTPIENASDQWLIDEFKFYQSMSKGVKIIQD